MAEKSPSGVGETTESLIKKLSFQLADNKQDVADHFYSCMRDVLLVSQNYGYPASRTASSISASSSLSNCGSASSLSGETDILTDQNKIHRFLSSVDHDKAREFMQLVSKVQNDNSTVLNNKRSSLKFLMNMARKNDKTNELVIGQRPDMRIPPIATNKPTIPAKPSLEKLYPVRKDYSSSPRTPKNSGASVTNGKFSSLLSTQISNESVTDGKQIPGSGSRSWSNQSRSRVNGFPTPAMRGETGLSEWDLIQAIIFTWQGIEGNVFRMDLNCHKYCIEEKFLLSKEVKEKAENLTWLGYQHNLLQKFCTSGKNSDGLVHKHLVAFVRDHLTDYYSFIANIQTQFQEELAEDNCRQRLRKSLTTMERLKLLALSPMKTFQDLNSILEFSCNCTGGYLASTVHCFLQHGDPDMQQLVKEILCEICKPLYAMLTNWLLDGEISDPYKEFFIASNNDIKGDKLWHEKYTVREDMLPIFISVQLANKILSVGKSINFLREICEDETPFPDRDKLKEMFANTSVEVMYLLEKEDELQQLVDLVYKHTSKRVMDVLIDKYSLLTHFQAHKKYLLLGQGDFVHYFMELVFYYLDKPAEQMYPHHLNGFLETAIRASTAQHDDENILKRLDTATWKPSLGDRGWDVFYLRYHVDGPIGTVFTVSENLYINLFYALWRAKRTEMVLSQIWKKQTTSAKFFRSIKELKPAVQQYNILTSEMIHFINQIQYYFLFEVLECCWNRLTTDIQQADNLDEIIAAHDQFLQTVLTGVFKNTQHADLSSQLRIIYDYILELEGQVETLVKQTQKEITERAIPKEQQDREYARRRREFSTKFVKDIHLNLTLLTKHYGEAVRKFVLTLNSQEELNLQLLSIRLDFNEYYKTLDSRVAAPLTFQHRRMSSIGGCSSYNSSPVLSRRTMERSRTPEIEEGFVSKHFK